MQDITYLGAAIRHSFQRDIGASIEERVNVANKKNVEHVIGFDLIMIHSLKWVGRRFPDGQVKQEKKRRVGGRSVIPAFVNAKAIHPTLSTSSTYLLHQEG